MDKSKSFQTPSFLTYESKSLDYSIFQLNLFLNGYDEVSKPYKIDYNTLLMSYHLSPGRSLDEFCQDQTIGYFLLNPTYDSAEAREAFCLEIREFLTGL
ncbi:hypothetical protein [Flagellimonas flava]|uniref:Uncharacterized protein n=1 Tax=Flagellimonas flava TaxID=570519 RepID=A0A1M5HXH2_9FLAO|nr:hypothetical protein [Allomuricauda flava]SHG20572.1 hypothetical protein SAMN04488116_0270 [Allomuricauda flava]